LGNNQVGEAIKVKRSETLKAANYPFLRVKGFFIVPECSVNLETFPIRFEKHNSGRFSCAHFQNYP
jgi:hypothetical protein